MESIKNKTKLSCYHCGEECKDALIHIQEKAFCCSGCKMVYEILNKNNLCEYYNISETPGITQKVKIRKNKFSFLDDSQIISKLIQFTDGKQTRVNFYLPQMHCSSCIWLLENLHQLNPEMVGSVVDFPKKEITVQFNASTCSLREVAELLTEIGYEPHINLSDIDEKKVSKLDRSRLFKMGIAGFCFGNIMMLSFPDYFSAGIYYEKGMGELFSFLSLALSLPVFFYSASEFYISAWKGVKQKFLNIDAPIVVALVITYTRSIYEIMTASGTGYLDSMSGIVFFMLVGRMFQDKVYNSISFERDYKSYFPVAVAVKKDGKEENIPVSRLKIGDRLIIRNNELIPADAILFYGKAKIDYSFVTGESLPIEKSIGEIIYAGGKQKGGVIEMEVVKEVAQSYLTQLWNNDAFQSKEEYEHSFIHQLSKHFTLILFSIAALTATYWYFVDSSKILNAVSSILIVACPCSLLLSATFTNGNILRIFSRNKFYLKNAKIIEDLASVNSIVFDKTGTITKNESTTLSYHGTPLSSFQQQLVKSLTAPSIHPLSQVIFNHFPTLTLLDCSDFTEYPGKGIEGSIMGIGVRLGSSEFIQGKKSNPENGTKVFIEIDSKLQGYFLLKNSYREGFEELASQLKKDYSIAVLSGDNATEKLYLQGVFGNSAQLLFQQSPEQKLNYIDSLQKNGKHVLMLGDGLNDAGALKASHVGIAITDSKNNFSPACDAVLEGSEFKNLKRLIDFARIGKKIILGSFILSILYNIVGISIAAQGTLSPMIAAILMPASSLSILLFTVGLSSAFAWKKGMLS